MVKPGDIDGFATAILNIIQNDDLNYEMGKSSLEKPMKNIHWKAI